jgi:hypothetical protein
MTDETQEWRERARQLRDKAKQAKGDCHAAFIRLAQEWERMANERAALHAAPAARGELA